LGADAPKAEVCDRVVYSRVGETALEALIFPKSTGATPPRGPRPGVILIHGGAWLSGSPYQHWWYSRRFAEAGYVVMAIEYRTMDDGAFPAALHDAKAAARWLRRNSAWLGVDPDAIAVMGDSAGGHLAAMLSTTRPEDGFEGTTDPDVSSAVQAAVLLYPMTDLASEVNARTLAGRLWRRLSFNYHLVSYLTREMEGSLPERARLASPIQYTHAGAPPTLIIHGSLDRNVHPIQSLRYYTALQNLGVQSAYIQVGRTHAFDYYDPRLRGEIFGDILRFLHENLRGAPDPEAYLESRKRD
jgi:acetyl esterase/lipase